MPGSRPTSPGRRPAVPAPSSTPSSTPSTRRVRRRRRRPATTSDSYTGILYVIDALPCGWLGLGYIGWERAYAKGTASLGVVGHEFGHNFGLYHAGRLNCGSSTIATTGCSVIEYGDPFDIMGNISSMHLAASQKRILGYIGAIDDAHAQRRRADLQSRPDRTGQPDASTRSRSPPAPPIAPTGWSFAGPSASTARCLPAPPARRSAWRGRSSGTTARAARATTTTPSCST